MGFENPYRNIGRDIGCFLAILIIVLLATGYGLGKLF